MGIPARFHAWDSKDQQWRYAAGTVCELSIVLTGAAFYHKVRANASSTVRRPEEFENGGFTLKTLQMFSLHTKMEKYENVTITGHFGFVTEKLSQANYMIIVTTTTFISSPSPSPR